MPELNLGDLIDDLGEESDNSLWPAGTYTLEIVGANAGKSAKGKPKLGIQWEILDGDLVGKRTWQNIYLDRDNKTSASIFVRTLEALGFSRDEQRKFSSMQEIAEELPGKVATVVVKIKDWSDGSGRKSNDFVVKPYTEQVAEVAADGNLFGEMA